MPINLTIAINGEGVQTSAMISTPGAAAEYNNVSSSLFVDIPSGCCSQISIKNTGTSSLSIQNANLIVERMA